MAVTQAEEKRVPIFPGECVEIFGLTSESGKQLNGCNGVVTSVVPGTGRFEVRVGVDKRVTVKQDNVRLIQKDVGSVAAKLGFGDADRKAECAAAGAFREGELVEVCGVEGPNGRDINGKTGTVVLDYETPPDRVKVKVNLGNVMDKDRFRHVTLKPCNVKKASMAGLTDEQRAQMRSLQDVTAESVEENVLRSQLNRLEAQERHTGKDPFAGVELSFEPGPAGEGGLQPGDVVEVKGLTSAAGQLLNGDRGVVLGHAEGRAEVRLPGGSKRLQPQNLRRLDLAAGGRFLVQVCGLQSEGGRAMNGQRGIAVARTEAGRFEVRLSKEKSASLKPENLQLLTKKR